jgi:tRNA(Ile)-lysidine synthase
MTSIEKKLTEAAASVLKGRIGSHLVLSFSGGPDSSALLDILHTLSTQPAGGGHPFHLSLFYLNHNLRSEPECLEEENLVRSAAGRYGVKIHMESVPRGDLTRLAAATGTSLEDAARTERYRRLNLHLETHPGPAMAATAHHNDDQLETLVIRFFQGSRSPGLVGMAECSGSLLRPLIHVDKSDIDLFLEGKEIPFVRDQSNDSLLYLRNRVRHELIPSIARIFPGYRTALNRMADDNRRAEDLLSATLPVWEPRSAETPGGGLVLSLSDFAALEPAARFRLLMDGSDRVLKGTVRPGFRIPGRFFSPLTEGSFSLRSGYRLEGHGLVLAIEGTLSDGYLSLSPDTGSTGGGGFFYRLEGNMCLTIGPLTISTGSRPDESAEFCFGPAGPFVCRSFLPGDTIRMHGQGKKLKKLFGEWGVPASFREHVPVFEGTTGVVAVAGGPFGGKNCLADGINPPKYGDFSDPFLYIVVKRTGGNKSFYA